MRAGCIVMLVLLGLVGCGEESGGSGASGDPDEFVIGDRAQLEGNFDVGDGTKDLNLFVRPTKVTDPAENSSFRADRSRRTHAGCGSTWSSRATGRTPTRSRTEASP